jgi:hypothetical protein
MLGISLIAAQLAASQEGLSSLNSIKQSFIPVVPKHFETF